MLRIRTKFKSICEEISGIRKSYGLVAISVVIIYVIVTKVFLKGVVFPLEMSDNYTGSDRDKPFYEGCVDTGEYLKNPQYEKMNATFVMLTRNDEVDDVVHSINSLESHFNQWFHYPYVFLNDVPFTEEFQRSVKSVVSGDVQFGVVDKDMWQIPEERNNPKRFQNAIGTQSDRAFLYGGSISYHRMCRFYSGSFYKHPLVQRYEWYWRVEPDVDYYCDITYDPFFEMAKHNKKYGFNIITDEIFATVSNLFRYTMAFIKKYKLEPRTLWKLFSMNHYIMQTSNEELRDWVNFHRDAEPKIVEKIFIEDLLKGKDPQNKAGLDFLIGRAKSPTPIIEDKFENEEYNLYHFWSNFEIARVDAFDNPIYNAYFNYLDEVGGFWKERWGDAPVHSLGLALVMDVEDIHYFRDIGYQHSVITHCPNNAPGKQLTYKEGDPRRKRGFFSDWYDSPGPNGSGCRCSCRMAVNKEYQCPECIERWIALITAEDRELNGGRHFAYVDAIEEEKRLRKLLQS